MEISFVIQQKCLLQTGKKRNTSKDILINSIACEIVA